MSATREEEVIFETPSVAEESKEDTARIRDILQQKHDKDNKDITRAAVDPQAAFEIFAGRVYTAPSRSEVLSVADSAERKAETPLQRFTRLKQELADLTTDLDVLVESKPGRNDADAISPWEVLQQESQHLQQQLALLKESGAYEPFLGEQRPQTSSVQIQDLLNKLTLQTSQQARPDEGAQNVTYELYYDPSLAQSESNPSLARLEARIRQLEEFLGPVPLTMEAEQLDGHRGTLPLSEAIAKLEQRALLLDDAYIESLKQKIPALKAELDPLSQSRLKGMDSRITEHASRIEATYDKVQKMEPIALELPRIVSRMRTLEALHREAALFSQRLARLENTFDGLSEQLASNDAVLNEVSQSMKANLETLQTNIQAVEERLNSK